MNISRGQVMNRLREAGFTFQRKGKREEIWRRKGGPDYVNLSVHDTYPEVYVRVVLQNAGLSPAEVEQFLRDATT